MLLTYRIIARGQIGGIKTKTTCTPPRPHSPIFFFRPAQHGILFTGYCIHMQFCWVCEFVSFRCTFSALRILKNSLRSTMKQDRLNNCILMHCHKSIYGLTLDTVKIVKRFACADEQRKGNLSRDMRMAGWKMCSPPPTPTFQNSPPPLCTYLKRIYFIQFLSDSRRFDCSLNYWR